MTRAIRKHAVDFIAIIAMAAVAIGVAVYIILNQDARPTLPLVEDKPVAIKAEFSDAQAVVPGQGQSVRVAGVEVGKIGSVELENGIAVVTLNINRDFAPRVRQDATALLRPRTGLKDMFVELDPGTDEAPVIPEGGRIGVENTAPDIDPDEILDALDTDTRAYLKLLISGVGKGLHNHGDDLALVMERFEPLHRDLKRVNGALAARRNELARLIRNYGLLVEELGKNEDALAELVTASNTTFAALGSVDVNISEAVGRLPGALQQTVQTLEKANALGQVLGPTLEQLRPAVRKIDTANKQVLPLVRQGEPQLRNEIRPFVRRAKPYIEQVRPAAQKLNAGTPDLTTSFLELNRFFNMAAFNPADVSQRTAKRPRSGAEPITGDFEADRNREEGFLFWVHWVAANGNSVFSTSDAHGPFRRVLLQLNCRSIQGLVENYSEEFRAGLPDPLKPLSDQFSTAAATLIFGQDPLVPCAGP